jgi:hypothetical protein
LDAKPKIKLSAGVQREQNVIKVEFVYNRIITNLLKNPKLDGVLLRVADIFLKTTERYMHISKNNFNFINPIDDIYATS